MPAGLQFSGRRYIFSHTCNRLLVHTSIEGLCGIRWILQELKQNLDKELDFRLEARNAERLSSCMAGLRRVAIPKPVPQARES